MFVIKEFFSEEQYSMMYEELQMFYATGTFLDSKEVGGAFDKDGNLLRNTKGLPIESVMEDSVIVSCFDKQIKQNDHFKDLKATHLINAYSKGHFYDFHKDNCLWTAITVFHKVPKKYTGGQLTFRDEDSNITEIDLSPRDCVLFPGHLDHKVSPIDNQSDNPFDGRISVSRFMK